MNIFMLLVNVVTSSCCSCNFQDTYPLEAEVEMKSSTFVWKKMSEYNLYHCTFVMIVIIFIYKVKIIIREYKKFYIRDSILEIKNLSNASSLLKLYRIS